VRDRSEVMARVLLQWRQGGAPRAVVRVELPTMAPQGGHLCDWEDPARSRSDAVPDGSIFACGEVAELVVLATAAELADPKPVCIEFEGQCQGRVGRRGPTVARRVSGCDRRYAISSSEDYIDVSPFFMVGRRGCECLSPDRQVGVPDARPVDGVDETGGLMFDEPSLQHAETFLHLELAVGRLAHWLVDGQHRPLVHGLRVDQS
jgi:hypothetical protein